MNYWTQRYLNDETGWDIGYVSTPIKDYVDQLTDKNIKILIPGCGNGYEPEYIHRLGFLNIHVCDISPLPLQNLKKRCPSFPAEHMHEGDFFQLDDSYDLILEQTFFCALPPTMREHYIKKCYDLLSPEGKLVGLLFNVDFPHDGPPHGGNRKEYEKIFDPYFKINTLAEAYNSIKPRQGNELFFNFSKRS